MSPERSVKDLFGLYKTRYGGEGGIRTLVDNRLQRPNNRRQATLNKRLTDYVKTAWKIAGVERAVIDGRM